MTAEEFFKQINIPSGWKYLGWNNSMNGDDVVSYGLVFDPGLKNTKMRLFYMPASETGGLVKKTAGEFNLLLSNKSAEEINEYLRNHY